MSFLKPEQALSPLGIREGSRVADFGAGSGVYALVMAHRAGHSGRVYAIDVQKELLTRLARHASEKRVTNLEVVWGNVDEVHGSKLADESVDCVLVANILFQSEHVAHLAKEAKRILKSDGKVLVIEWSESFNNLGPSAGHVVKESEAKLFFADAGFVYDARQPAGDHHYSLLFHKP